MNCPKCNSFLKKKEAVNKPYRIYVGECVGCSGWWFDSNNLEEYRASILPTSQYTVLPKFESIANQIPTKCCYCEENTLLWNNVDSQVILHCSKCFGIFLSKEQVLEIVKKELSSEVETGLWALFLSSFFWS